MSGGNYSFNEGRVAVSGPVSDTISLGIAALHSQRDGFVADRVSDRDYGDKDTRAIRGSLAFTPSERLRIDLSADYSEDNASMTVGQPLNSLTYLFTPTVSIALPTNPATYDFTGRTSPSLPNKPR